MKFKYKTVIILENLNVLMVSNKKLNGTDQACLEFRRLKANQSQTNFETKTVTYLGEVSKCQAQQVEAEISPDQ